MELQIFDNAEFGKIRTVLIGGIPYFVGRDVATALGYVNTKDALVKHVDARDKKIVDLNREANYPPITDAVSGGWIKNNVTVINESGLYSLVMSSKLPRAQEFRHWVTSEVLPALRQHGFYSMHADKDIELYKKIAADPQFLIEIGKALQAANDKVKQLTEENENLVKQVYEMAPKASYYDLILQCTQAIPTTVIAKDYGLTNKKCSVILHVKEVKCKWRQQLKT